MRNEKKKKPLVSVIMPTFNRQNLVRDAIASILNQDWSNWELIVVDDCSTDGTDQAVRNIGDSRIRYVKTSVNSGHPSIPRNLGISESGGELVAYLDDDNRFRKGHLERLAGTLLDSDAGMAYGNTEIHFGDKPETIIRDIPFSIEHLALDNYIDTSDVMHWRHVIDVVGGWRSIWAEDWDLWKRISAAFPIVHVDEVLTDYWFHGDSRTARLLGENAVDENTIRPYLVSQKHMSARIRSRRHVKTGDYPAV